MSKVLPVITFAAGAAIGSVASFFVVKAKYEKIAQEEIDSVKETYRSAAVVTVNEVVEDPSEDEESEDDEDDREELSVREYAAKLSETGYTNYNVISSDEDEKVVEDIPEPEKTDEDVAEHPYVITPDEFGMVDDYDTISLTYFADKILADDRNELVENVNEVVGRNSLTKFGIYEDDAVYVRNERLKADYEILLDERTYMEVLNLKRPRIMEV